MKKKLYGMVMVMVLCITCIGCGKKDNDTATTEAAVVAEATTEASDTDTSKTDTKKDTKTDTQKNTKKDNKKQDTGKQSTTEVSDTNRSNQTNGTTRTASRTTGQSANQTTSQSSTQAPAANQSSATQPSTQAPASNRPASTTEAATTTTTCNHNWVEITQTVHHEAEMGERCAQSAVVHHWWCFDCNSSYPEVTDDPCGGINGGTAQIVVQDAVFEQYVVTPAYDETVGTGRYRCSRCGATK